MAAVEVLGQFTESGGVAFVGPYHFGGVDGRVVIDPLLEEIVIGAVVYDGELLAGVRLELRQDTGTRGIAGAGVIPGHRPIRRHVGGEGLCANPKYGHGEAHHGASAKHGDSRAAAAMAPRANVTHAL